MEEKVLYNVLKAVDKGNAAIAAPDQAYLKALETLGMIKLGWDTELTKFGSDTLERLRNVIEKW